MPLPWIRLDTQFASNPKILMLLAEDGFRAAFGFVCGLTYSGGHGTDGFIPAEALPYLHCTQYEADLLVKHRLWHPSHGGWRINGWTEFQMSNEETQKRRERLTKISKKGNCVRWHGPDCGCWETA